MLLEHVLQHRRDCAGAGKLRHRAKILLGTTGGAKLWVNGTSVHTVGKTRAATIHRVLLPVAPPRMLPGYADVLASTSAHGWWGGDASAPKGLGLEDVESKQVQRVGEGADVQRTQAVQDVVGHALI